MFRTTFAFATLGILAQSCGGFFQTLNSSAEDEARYGSADAIVASATDPVKFGAARQVLLDRCVSCHSDFGSNTEAAFKAAGDVAAGSPSTSVLYTKIRGADAAGDQNMPPQTTLSSSEIQAIRDWILSVL